MTFYKSIRLKTGLESDQQLEIRLQIRDAEFHSGVSSKFDQNTTWQPIESSLHADSISTINTIKIKTTARARPYWKIDFQCNVIILSRLIGEDLKKRPF